MTFKSWSWLLVAVLLGWGTGARAQTHDIIIYGGGFGGVAAALSAQDAYRALKGGVSARILLINPQAGLGGLGAVNGQNFYDVRLWTQPSTGAKFQPQQGNHIKFFNQYGQYYSTGQMSSYLNGLLTAKGGITLKSAYDLRAVTRSTTTGKVTSVQIQKVKRSSGSYLFDAAFAVETYSAPVYIDAGENARFAELASIVTSLGRQDRNPDMRQMVATLMFKVKNIDINAIKAAATTQASIADGWRQNLDQDGTQGFLGGAVELRDTNKTALQSYNNTNERFQIKAMNAAEDKYAGSTAGAGEYWINTLIIYGVDGTCERKDGCPDINPVLGVEYWSADYAYQQALAQLNSTAFINALKQMPGFANYLYVTDAAGNKVVGDLLYLREVVHTQLNTSITSETNFAITGAEVGNAGATSTTGNDTGNFANRIGLGYYWMDSNGYNKTFANGAWTPVKETPPGAAANPVYLPYEALITSQMPNVLTPGYSSSTGSWAWTSVRVLPNLTVLGDAAGVAAAYAVVNARDPSSFDSTLIANVRSRIVTQGGRVDK